MVIVATEKFVIFSSVKSDVYKTFTHKEIIDKNSSEIMSLPDNLGLICRL